MKFFSALRAPRMRVSQAGALVWKVRANARADCESAMTFIKCGDYATAIILLRAAHRTLAPGKAWSKLMLAIRELSRIA